MSNIRGYEIAVPLSAVEKLHEKLAVSTFPDEVDGAGWERVPPVADVKRNNKVLA